MRVWQLVASGAAAAALGVGSASALLPSRTGGDTLGGPEDLQPSDQPVTIAAQRPDPVGGPDWAVRIYQSQTGLTCPEAGRSDGTDFGALHADGTTVDPLPVEAAGSCGDLGSAPVIFATNHYASPPRTVVFGVASADVASVAVTGPDGDTALPLDRGAFLFAHDGVAFDGHELVVTLRDATTVRYAIG
jgi:hypothetical protein